MIAWRSIIIFALRARARGHPRRRRLRLGAGRGSGTVKERRAGRPPRVNDFDDSQLMGYLTVKLLCFFFFSSLFNSPATIQVYIRTISTLIIVVILLYYNLKSL